MFSVRCGEEDAGSHVWSVQPDECVSIPAAAPPSTCASVSHTEHPRSARCLRGRRADALSRGPATEDGPSDLDRQNVEKREVRAVHPVLPVRRAPQTWTSAVSTGPKLMWSFWVCLNHWRCHPGAVVGLEFQRKTHCCRRNEQRCGFS